MMPPLDPWYLENLRCPLSGQRLTWQPERSVLTSGAGHVYPVVEGVPVMLPPEVAPTLAPISASREASASEAPWYLSSVLVSAEEKAGIQALIDAGRTAVDPVAAYLVAATNGVGYLHLIGKLQEYPIPEIRLPPGDGRLLLDVGCSWGRWCVAAARKGYTVVGMDPSLGAVMAARRITRSMGLEVRFVVGDARHLPFAAGVFDDVFSYSVIQHLSVGDAERSFEEIGRVLKTGGGALIQMPTSCGLRCLYNQARRGFREPRGFEVRYWRISRLREVLGRHVGAVAFSVDCFFGIGWQPSDAWMMPMLYRIIIRCSEILRLCSRFCPPLLHIADSVYAHAVKRGGQ